MRLCLNMIVKNESAILERCLLSARPHIDCYFICDTGSTDDTVQIINRVLKDVPGEVLQTTFLNFEQARNEALQGAVNSTLEFDYLLLIDADMELVAETPQWRENLSHPAYTLRQVCGTFSYHNVRLVARHNKARYVGLTHEFLQLENRGIAHRDVFMLDHACGSSRTEKTERDLALLNTAIEQNPSDARSFFYLAQTLREAGRHDEAITAYEQRITLGGWDEEVWFSLFMIARCHEAKKDFPRFLTTCLKAYNLRPCRAEPLHAMAHHYRCQGEHDACSMLCEAGLQILFPDDVLFLQEDVYNTGFRHELSICGFYSKLPKRRALARQFCEELTTERSASPEVRENARSNWIYYAQSARQLFKSSRFVESEQPVVEDSRFGEPWLKEECPAALEDQQSSSGLMAFDEGWLCLTQQIRSQNERTIHLHRFVQLDTDFCVRAITESFYFEVLGPENKCALNRVPGEDQLLVGFLSQESKARLLIVEADDVRRELRNVST